MKLSAREKFFIRDSMVYYQNQRWSHAQAISQTSYRTANGKKPTTEMITSAIDTAREVDNLVGRLYEEDT